MLFLHIAGGLRSVFFAPPQEWQVSAKGRDSFDLRAALEAAGLLYAASACSGTPAAPCSAYPPKRFSFDAHGAKPPTPIMRRTPVPAPADTPAAAAPAPGTQSLFQKGLGPDAAAAAPPSPRISFSFDLPRQQPGGAPLVRAF